MTIDDRINEAVQAVSALLKLPHTIKDNRILIPIRGSQANYIRCTFSQYVINRTKIYRKETDKISVTYALVSEARVFLESYVCNPRGSYIAPEEVASSLEEFHSKVNDYFDYAFPLELGNIPDGISVQKHETRYKLQLPMLTKEQAMAVLNVFRPLTKE